MGTLSRGWSSTIRRSSASRDLLSVLGPIPDSHGRRNRQWAHVGNSSPRSSSYQTRSGKARVLVSHALRRVFSGARWSRAFRQSVYRAESELTRIITAGRPPRPPPARKKRASPSQENPSQGIAQACDTAGGRANERRERGEPVGVNQRVRLAGLPDGRKEAVARCDLMIPNSRPSDKVKAGGVMEKWPDCGFWTFRIELPNRPGTMAVVESSEWSSPSGGRWTGIAPLRDGSVPRRCGGAHTDHGRGPPNPAMRNFLSYASTSTRQRCRRGERKIGDITSNLGSTR